MKKTDTAGYKGFSPPTQYSPVQQIYYPQQNYQYRPYSGYYRNPYAYPLQNYNPYYYDWDQYYVPPRMYQGREDSYAPNYQTTTDGFNLKY